MKVSEKQHWTITFTPYLSCLTFSNLHSVSPRFSDAIVSQRDNNLIKFISNLEAMFAGTADVAEVWRQTV